jgi:hypothetical protein
VNAKKPEAPPYPPDDSPKGRATIPMAIAVTGFYSPFADRSLHGGCQAGTRGLLGTGPGDHARAGGPMQLAGTS